MKTLYLECYSGISGDMTVAALLDLGANKEVLLGGLESLNVGGYDIKISRVNKAGIDACDFDVVLHRDHEHADHPHTYLPVQDSQKHDHHSHIHIEEHSHHDHNHDHNYGHNHEHRNLSDIIKIIGNSKISDNAKQMAKKIFTVIAKAESEVHGVSIDEIHFHEVGAIDSIVDVVATAICIDNLGIEKIIVSVLYEGTGYVKCQHGLMPVPAPATAKIISAHGIPLKITENKGEMVTPTGAGIVGALSDSFTLPESFTIDKIGFGAGKKEFKSANVIRAYIIKEEEKNIAEEIIKIETNVDDMTGESLGFAMEKLFNAGAKDVYFTPIYMKKNRPATMITVLCEKLLQEKIIETLFLHTSTIGVRTEHINRTIMERRTETAITSLGEAVIKTAIYGDITKKTVEFESAKKIALEKKLPIDKVFAEIKKLF